MPRGSAIMLALAVILLADQCSYASYIDPGDEDIEINGPDYDEDPSDLQILQDVGKRACIRQGGNCDHRPGDCCHSSSCRCNIWGSNCRCQRMGLFQKWGLANAPVPCGFTICRPNDHRIYTGPVALSFTSYIPLFYIFEKFY